MEPSARCCIMLRLKGQGYQRDHKRPTRQQRTQSHCNGQEREFHAGQRNQGMGTAGRRTRTPTLCLKHRRLTWTDSCRHAPLEGVTENSFAALTSCPFPWSGMDNVATQSKTDLVGDYRCPPVVSTSSQRWALGAWHHILCAKSKY